MLWCRCEQALPDFTRAMALIDAARATSVTINATVDGGIGDWSPAAEVYPITLGWGVTLNAPGVYYLDMVGQHRSIFDVNFYSPDDIVGYASVVGSAASAIGIGLNAANTQQTTDYSAITIEGTLYIASASLNASAISNAAISVYGNVVLGQDRFATTIGTVYIGNAQQSGNIGIDCEGSDLVSSTVVDAALDGGQSSVVIQGQPGLADIYAFDCNVNLTSRPILGIPPAGSGFGKCGNKQDHHGMLVTGSSSVVFNNGTIQCQDTFGIAVYDFNNNNPMAYLDSDVIENTGVGIESSAGAVSVTNTTIEYNFVGVQQDYAVTTGLVDLGGGGNTVVCSSSVEGGTPGNYAGSVGADVYNPSSVLLNASNVAWDTPGPDYFTCDSTLTTCTCNIASCTTVGGSDDMDAVETPMPLSDGGSALGGITTTGNTVSPLALDAGCQ